MGSAVRVLDLGSGKGAAARHLAERFGCHVTCFNLGRNQNAHNVAEARSAGLEHLVDTVLGNFNSGLPAEWTASFDVVWSQEALCHAKDQTQVLKEVHRVLKPGGVIIFTDIMRTVRPPPRGPPPAAAADGGRCPRLRADLLGAAAPRDACMHCGVGPVHETLSGCACWWCRRAGAPPLFWPSGGGCGAVSEHDSHACPSHA